MPVTDTTDPENEATSGFEDRLAQAGHKLLEMFIAVCAAPDDPAVAASANEALRDLDILLRN